MTEETTHPRYTGKIIFVSDKGWGFITTPDIKFTRIFFHWTGLDPKLRFESLCKGQMVTFSVKEYDDKGMRAIKIEVLNDNKAESTVVN
jgi:cold shock CspA family protein